MTGKRGGRASAGLTALVLQTYGPVCHLNMPGCLRVATTKDHLIPYSHGGKDTLENLRPACKRCNSKRQNRVLSGHGAVIHVVMGPPAAGKTTLVLERARQGDIIIDLDALAAALTPIPADSSHTYPEHVWNVAIGARTTAIDRAIRTAARCHVWIIHAIPHPNQLAEYRALRYDLIVVDPGREVVEQRARTMRPRRMWPAVAKWYASGINLTPAHPAIGTSIDGPTLVKALAAPSTASSDADW